MPWDNADARRPGAVSCPFAPRPTVQDPTAILHTVLWATLGASAALGAVMHRSQFCAMGAVADIVTFGDWGRMRMWMLAVATALVGTSALAATGQIDLSHSIYTVPDLTWLSALVGGLLFGFGMVLASGCGSKTLVRIGGGNLKAVGVFLTLGLGAYMGMKGIAAPPRVYGLDRVALHLAGTQDLPSLLSRHSVIGAVPWRLLLGVGGGLGLGAWALWPRESRQTATLLGGLGVGALVVALWWISAHMGHLDVDPDTLEPTYLGSTGNHAESFTFVAPLAYTINWLILFTDSSNVLTLGIVSVFGVIAGAAAHALATGRFRWEGFAGTEDTARHLLGGLLMGIGGVTAMGCTIGQGITGVSTLSPTSVIALLSIIGGAVLGVRYTAWRLERHV